MGTGEVCGLVCLVVVEVENWNWRMADDDVGSPTSQPCLQIYSVDFRLLTAQPPFKHGGIIRAKDAFQPLSS